MVIKPTLKLVSNGIVIINLVLVMRYEGSVDNSEVLSIETGMNILLIEMVSTLTLTLSSGRPNSHLFCDRPMYTYGRHSKWSVVVIGTVPKTKNVNAGVVLCSSTFIADR